MGFWGFGDREAGQIDFPAEQVLRRGRIEAGGMLYFDHATGESYHSQQVLERLAKEKDYQALLAQSCLHLEDLPKVELAELENPQALIDQRHTAYSLNQESFKFLLDPILQTGLEKVSAMGYGLTPNALSAAEGGMFRYFSQRFAQVTNPPLDSLRESDGMSLRVALGAKPTFALEHSKQLAIASPILQRHATGTNPPAKPGKNPDPGHALQPGFRLRRANELALEQAVLAACEQVEAAARANTGIIILSRRRHQRR